MGTLHANQTTLYDEIFYIPMFDTEVQASIFVSNMKSSLTKSLIGAFYGILRNRQELQDTG